LVVIEVQVYVTNKKIKGVVWDSLFSLVGLCVAFISMTSLLDVIFYDDLESIRNGF